MSATAVLNRRMDMFAENACTEAHHRMADSLAVLASLIDRKIKDRPPAGVIAVSDVRDMTEEAGSRSWPQSSRRAAENLHHFRIASSHSHAVDLAGYLQRIASSVLHFFGEGQRDRCFMRFPVGCGVPAGHAATFGLFTVEAITNALKYAHPRDETDVGRVPLRKRLDLLSRSRTTASVCPRDLIR